jgi:hypothetical protein
MLGAAVMAGAAAPAGTTGSTAGIAADTVPRRIVLLGIVLPGIGLLGTVLLGIVPPAADIPASPVADIPASPAADTVLAVAAAIGPAGAAVERSAPENLW